MHSIFAPYQLFCFDFDGLLVDTEPLHCEAYCRTSKEWGLPWDWDYATYCLHAHSQSLGVLRTMEKRFPELLGEEGKRFIRRKQEIYAELLEEKPPPLMPGVEAFLDALERGGRTRCVVTNSLRSHVDIVRRTSPALQKIPLWLTREDYARPKPAADGYQAALLHTECQAVHAVGFEDTIKGVKALAGAGIQAIWICPKHQLQEEACQELKAQHFESFLHINI